MALRTKVTRTGKRPVGPLVVAVVVAVLLVLALIIYLRSTSPRVPPEDQRKPPLEYLRRFNSRMQKSMRTDQPTGQPSAEPAPASPTGR